MTALRLAPRTYPDIVRDVLTTLTAGVAGEEHTVPAVAPVPAGERTEPVTIQLRRRPVRRVSSVTGWVARPGAPRPLQPEDMVAATFTLDDYELVAEADDPDALNTIRFRPFAGKVPAPGTTVVVNYYPRSADASPITDVTVGSVARTLLEAVSHELAVLYGQLEQAYQSAFLETATGSSLDRVVGLLGYSRARAGRAVGAVRFSRRPGAAGTIVIPAGTPITDTQDTVRYETSESRTMLAGESTTEIRVRGVDPATPVVEAGVLAVVQRAIAGIDAVTNERPTALASTDESDEELRARAGVALLASNKGTVPAIRNGLLQLPAVRAVTVEEMPNGVAGEIRVTVGLADPADAGPGGELPASVEAKLEELRPAGVRLVRAAATPQSLAAEVALTTAGGPRPPAEVERLTQRVASQISGTVRRTGVGQRVRLAGLVAVALAEEGVVDAQIRLGPRGDALGAAGADLQPDAGAMVDLDPADVAVVVTSEDETAGGGEARVVVRVTLTATTVGATTTSDVERAARAALSAALQRPHPGSRLDAPALLALLRDDSRYGLDPLGCRFTFSAGEQYVDVAQGGAAFTVQAGQRFEMEAVEVREPRNVTPLDTLLDLLPDPWTLAEDSVLAAILGAAALELETIEEDLDRLRRSHWFSTAWRIEDLAGLAASVGVEPLAWEDVAAFRERLDATVVARRRGSISAGELRRFAYDYLADLQERQGATFVPGLRPGRPADEAFDLDESAPAHRRMAFLEFPRRRARSKALSEAGNVVPYLFRWTERNAGLFEAIPQFTITGLVGGRTAVPLLANVSTGQLLGYAGVVGAGRQLRIRPADQRIGDARATLDGADVSDRLFSVSHFQPGQPFGLEELDAQPRVPRLGRGNSDWWYLSVGLHGVDGLDRVPFAIADLDLRQAVFDESDFDHALFPTGPAAGLAMTWTEREPATFRLRVPAGIVVERAGRRVHAEVMKSLRESVEQLRAAGIRGGVEAAGFRDRQGMRVRVRLPWVRLPSEDATAGRDTSLTLGARYGDSGLGDSRFE